MKQFILLALTAVLLCACGGGELCASGRGHTGGIHGGCPRGHGSLSYTNEESIPVDRGREWITMFDNKVQKHTGSNRNLSVRFRASADSGSVLFLQWILWHETGFGSKPFCF